MITGDILHMLCTILPSTRSASNLHACRLTRRKRIIHVNPWWRTTILRCAHDDMSNRVFTTYKLNHRTALDQINRSDIYCGSEWHPQDIPWVHDLLRQYILRVLVLKLKHATSSYTINDFGYHQHWMTSHQMGPIRGARLKQLARKPYTKYNFGLSLACSLYDFSDWFWHWKYGILSSIRSFITIQMVKCHVDVIMLPSVTICYHQNMFKLPSSTIS